MTYRLSIELDLRLIFHLIRLVKFVDEDVDTTRVKLVTCNRPNYL